LRGKKRKAPCCGQKGGSASGKKGSIPRTRQEKKERGGTPSKGSVRTKKGEGGSPALPEKDLISVIKRERGVLAKLSLKNLQSLKRGKGK